MGGRGDTCFGVAKIQGYVNFACYKTGGHGCFVPWLEMVKVRGHTREFGGGLWRARLLQRCIDVPNVSGGSILAGGRVAIADVVVECRADNNINYKRFVL